MRISDWSSDVCSSDLIKSFLAKITTPHLELEVLNPLFEEIQLEFDVQYRSEDIAFFTQQLRSDLEQFLAPWAFEHSSDIRFGSSVNKSVLDRKSVVSGKSVAVRVDLGGRRIIKKKIDTIRKT